MNILQVFQCILGYHTRVGQLAYLQVGCNRCTPLMLSHVIMFVLRQYRPDIDMYLPDIIPMLIYICPMK